MSDTMQNFGCAVRQLKRRWQAGLVVEALLQAVGWLVVAVGVIGVLDFFIGFEESVRMVLDTVVVAGLLCLLFARGVGIVRLGAREAAERADDLLSNPRRLILSAHELHGWMQTAGVSEDLRTFLVNRSIGRATEELRRLRWKDHLPVRELVRRFRRLAVQAVVVGLIAGLGRDAAPTIAARILFPYRDIPPFSRFVFKVVPASPTVSYGGTLEVAVEVSGAPLQAPVVFRSRAEGRTYQAMCFQESGNRFAQRMERVVAPVEFCFATGRARSRWIPVEIMLQPQIAVGEVILTPPAYSRQSPRRFFVGNEDVAGLRQSRVQLALTSNRPLLDGTLTVKPAGSNERAETVRGQRTGPKTVTFEWTIRDTAEVEAVIRDSRGVACRESLRIHQKVVEDEPPKVSFSEPAGFALATPSVSIPVTGTAEDDIGIERVQMVRTLVGYRDRTKPLGPIVSPVRFDIQDKVDLKTLGAKPGDVLELYLEATDINPALTGVTVSDIVRINVISDEEYAAMVRAQTTMEDMVARYRAVDEQVSKLEAALKRLQDALAAGKPDATQKALDEAREVGRQTMDLFRKLSADLQLYEMEAGLNNALRDITAKLNGNINQLGAMKGSDPALARLVDAMMKDLAGASETVKQERVNAEETASVARVMEFAIRFRQLVARQTQIARRLERCRDEGRDMKLLASLGREEEAARQELSGIVTGLPAAADQLIPGYGELQQGAKRFAKAVGDLDIEGFMKKSTVASENQDGREAHRNAALALEKMEQLLDNEDSKAFGGMCKGDGGVSFKVPKGAMQGTMEQMLRAIAARLGARGKGTGDQGEGQSGLAGGGMFGGAPNDGYWTGGYSPLNVPVFGPERTTLSPGGLGKTGVGRGGTGAGSGRVGQRATEVLGGAGRVTTPADALQLDDVPEKYRDAVKRYFGKE